MKLQSITIAFLLCLSNICTSQVYKVKFNARGSSGITTSSETNIGSNYKKTQSKTKKKYGKKPLFKFGTYAASRLMVNADAGSRTILHFGETDIEQAYQFNLTDGDKTILVNVSDQYDAKSVKVLKRAELPVSTQYLQLGRLELDGKNWEFFLSDEHQLENETMETIGYLYGEGHEITIQRTKRSIFFLENTVKLATLDVPVFGKTTVTFEPNTTQSDIRMAISAVVSSLLMRKIINE
jgi:hypothetical protein